MGCTGSKYQSLVSDVADAPLVNGGPQREQGQEQGSETGPTAAAAPTHEPLPRATDASRSEGDTGPTQTFQELLAQSQRNSSEDERKSSLSSESPTTGPAPPFQHRGSLSGTAGTAPPVTAFDNDFSSQSDTVGDIEGSGVPPVPEEKEPVMPWRETGETWIGWGNSLPSKPYTPPPPPMPPVRPPPGAASPSGEPGLQGFENTVIIFDWDDTLLCSSALHCCQSGQFAELEQIVEKNLLTAMDLGRTVIVTNAMDSWIQETTRQFMPKLLPTLARLLIVYARENHERFWPGDTFAWKREAFRELLRCWVGRDLNLVVLGDSLSEIRAAEDIASKLGSLSAVKTVKFKALPSPSDLLGELRAISTELGRLVGEPRSSSKELVYDGAPRALSTFVKGPRCWSLVDAMPSNFDTMMAPGAAPWGPAPLWYAPQLPQGWSSVPAVSPGFSGYSSPEDGREARSTGRPFEVEV